MTKFIDFNNLATGTVVDNEFQADGVTISAIGGSNKAMIFDTSNPTGGDYDLATNNLGNVLIISEDGDSNDPDDEAHGGQLRFAFDSATTVHSLTFLDIEESAWVRFYDVDGNHIKTVDVHGVGNNGQLNVEFNVDNVGHMEVILGGSGAIDNLSFTPAAELDGVVEGDNSDDLIDAGYVDDPDGDRIDANDQILPGEGVDDDIVDALGGDDTVISGAGDDEVFAGSGDDSVEGGTGDDVIFGDSNYAGTNAGTTVRESFEWDQAGANNGGTLGGFTQDTGNVEVTFSIDQQSGASTTRFSTDNQNTQNIDADGNPVDDNSSLDNILNGHGNSADYDLDFSAPVEDVSFRINDIDGDGVVTVKAFDAAGNPIEVNLQGGDRLTLLDTDGVAGNDTADSNEGYLPDTAPEYSLLVSIPGPVSRIVIEHDQNGSDNSGINITDIYFDAPIVDDGTEGGNDILEGGVGNDTIFGEDGNDTLLGDDGNDSLEGGDGDDRIFGGAGNDTQIGGDGNDTLGGADFGDDLFIGGAGDDMVEASFGNDTIDGGTGNDELWASADNDLVNGGDGEDSIYGGHGRDTLFGDDGDDTISGGSDNDTIEGGEGNDLIRGDGNFKDDTGPGGNDLIDAGAGDDTVMGEDGDDTIDGGAGNDLLEGGEGRDSIDGGDGNDTILGGNNASVERLSGGDGDDSILGEGGIDVIRGGDGNDFLDSGDAHDELFGDAGNDTLLGGDSYDWIHGGTGDDQLFGEDGNDMLKGDEGNDLLVGGEGVDTIDGGADADTIVGGAGDVVDGGSGGFNTNPALNTDNDTLDLTGQGSFFLENVTEDSNGNGTNGTVVFVDGAGNPTGETIVFTEIENIIGDEINRAPDAVNDSDVTDEDTPITVDLLANDTDLDGDTLTVTGATVPENQGTLTDNGDGTVTFNPAENFNGEVTISYAITDGNGGTDTAIHTITVTPVNDAPVAVDDIAETFEDEPVVIDLIGNDTDVDGDPLNIGTVSVPAEQGTVVDNGDGTVTFTPAPNYTGPAEITYTVQDGQGGEDSGEAVVNVEVIGVNDGPQAVDDAATTDEDTPITIDVLDNDFDVEGDELSITVASVPAEQGTVEVVNDELVFTPAENFNGEATITYGITDTNGGSDIGEVIVTVTPVNDDPVAVDDVDTTDEDEPVVVDLIGNDTDVDGDPLTLAAVSVDPSEGTVSDNGDGTVTFTPAPNFNGPATITYTVEDGQGGSDEGQAVVSVGAINDGPVAGDDSDTTEEDTSITVDLLANDTDDDGDDLMVINATVPADQGTLVDNGDGTVTFTPAENFTGEATINYEISDSNGGTDTAIHTIDVTPVNDAPEAVDDSATTPFETPVTIDVLDNDFDVDGDLLTVVSATVPADQGTVDIVDNELVFTPADDFEGEATISYTISDGDLEDTAEVSVVVEEQPLDGIVEGTDGDDLIDADYTGDPQGDMVDNNDEILPGEGPNDDIIEAGDGDDTVIAGEGDDDVFGGEGDDDIDGGTGDDILRGDDGADTITGGDGSDTVEGGEGDDVIDTSNGDFAPDKGFPNDDGSPAPGFPFGFAADDDPENDRDSVDGGAGNDTISTGDDADTITGGSGNDVIDGGIDDDTITGDDGDDRIVGGEGNDTIEGGSGDDTIYAGNDPDLGLDQLNIEDDGSNPIFPADPRPDNGQDLVDGGAGNDLIFGADDDDTLFGGTGDDTLDGGIDDDLLDGGADDDSLIGGQGNDTLIGGDGNDTIDGGEGDDDLLGGDDRDTFINVNAGDVVDGNEGGDDFDTLDLVGSSPEGGSFDVVFDPANAENGVVNYFDENGDAAGTLTFTNIENVIPCFTPDTLIATAQGERLVQDLKVGDRVITRDNGIQEIRWVGKREMSGQELATAEHLRPVLIRQGALGQGLPERDMLVSPQHRVLMSSDKTALYFDESEVLVAAKHLTDMEGIDVVEVSGTTYIHVMFDQHEVILSDGTWTESFQPGDQTLASMSDDTRAEILELFPELATDIGIEAYTAARRSLKKHEASLLTQ